MGDLSHCGMVLWQFNPKLKTKPNVKSIRDMAEVIWLLRITY